MFRAFALRWTLPTLSLATLVLASCASDRFARDPRPRFHEAAATDVVLQHYRWQHINITKPQYREDGFLIQLAKNDVGPAFDRLGVRRDLAVVILGWGYAQEDLNRLVADWRTLLRTQGFKRVVCLHAGLDKKIDGLLIIDDTKQSDEATRHTAGN